MKRAQTGQARSRVGFAPSRGPIRRAAVLVAAIVVGLVFSAGANAAAGTST